MLPPELAPGAHAEVEGTIGYAELLGAFDEALAWLRDRGIPTAGSRYEAYRQALADLAANYAKPEWQPALERAFVALFEASDLRTIQSALAGNEIAGIVDRLRALVAGPYFPSEEELQDGGIHARNIAFELLVAGRLTAAGRRVELHQRGDVITTLGDQRVVVECKRPRRANTVRRCLERARQQALNDTAGRGAQGNSALIAIEASVVINPNNDLLRAAEPLSRALDRLSDRMADAVRVDMEGLWHERILGVIARFSALVASEGIPVYAQQWAALRNGRADPQRLQLAENLFEGLRTPQALRGAIPVAP